MEIKKSDIARMRLASQQIGGHACKTAEELVSRMGAMQAQDFNMVKWAIGVRLPGVSESTIEHAFNSGKIIRMHLLRPTWHLVPPGDIQGLLELTANRIKAAAASRHRQLELDEHLIMLSNATIEKALAGGKHLTRGELMSELEKVNIKAVNSRATHLMFCAELDGVVCSGRMRGGQQTYALLSERVPRVKSIGRDEALARLAGKYFTSHCPASAQDFAWWSGLPLGDARKAIDMIKGGFISGKIGDLTYWFPNSLPEKAAGDPVSLLPAFDEYIISYRDRSASLVFEHHKKAVSDNGVFRPIVVVNGLVKGIWKKTVKGNQVVVDVSLFQSVNKKNAAAIQEAVECYGKFLGQKTEMKVKAY
jgi:hypothetical protein